MTNQNIIVNISLKNVHYQYLHGDWIINGAEISGLPRRQRQPHGSNAPEVWYVEISMSLCFPLDEKGNG